MKRYLLICLLISLAVFAFGGKKALLIGNYNYPEGALPRVASDLALMDSTFTGIGFEVHKHQNLARDSLNQAVENFAKTVATGDTVAIYYSGHGFAASGNHYLVPVNLSVKAQAQWLTGSPDLNWIAGKLSKANAILAFLDTYRVGITLDAKTLPAPAKANPKLYILTSGDANLNSTGVRSLPVSPFTQALHNQLKVEGQTLGQIRANLYANLGELISKSLTVYTLGSAVSEEMILFSPITAEQKRWFFKSLELDMEGGGSYNF